MFVVLTKESFSVTMDALCVVVFEGTGSGDEKSPPFLTKFVFLLGGIKRLNEPLTDQTDRYLTHFLPSGVIYHQQTNTSPPQPPPIYIHIRA